MYQNAWGSVLDHRLGRNVLNNMQQTALTLEDYIGESYVKCANIILGSRIFQSEQQKPPADRRSGRWFLLDVEELSGLTQRLEPWRRDVYAPLIIEVSIRPWDTSTVMPRDSSSHPGIHTADAAAGGSMLLERWTLCFNQGVNSSSSGRASMDTAAVYKRLILLIRSLYSYVRVLPAYRMYRACKRHGGELFNTSYTLSTTADPSMQPMQPWPQQQQRSTAQAGGPSSSSSSGPQGGRLCHFAFSPVETLGGSFSIHVDYQPATTVHILEQTTIPVSMPRVIADYVDSPYARSAPHAADPISKQTADRATSSRLSGPDGPLALLRSSQQYHTPLVRHSWSSKDVSGPAVVQKGFNPISSSTQQQQQNLVLSHHRTSSQGSFTGGPPMSPASGGQSPVLGAVGNSSSSNSWGRPPLPHGATSQHHHSSTAAQPSAAPAAAGFSSSLPSGSSGYIPSGSSGLPPASPVTPSSGVRSPLFRSSSLSAAAAIGAGAPVAPASAAGQQQQQQAISRLGSTPPTLMQQVRHYQQYPKPPVQPLSPQSTQQGFHVKPAGLSDIQHSSSSRAAAAAAAAAAGGGDTNEVRGQVAVDSSDGSSTSSSQQVPAAATDSVTVVAGAHHSHTAAGVGNAGGQPEQQQQQQQLGSQEAPLGSTGTAAADPASVAEGPSSSSSGRNDPTASDAVRTVSAPLSIPASKQRGVRARSVSDLVQMGAEGGPGNGGDGARYPSAQQQQQQGTVTSEWLQAQDGQVSATDSTAAAAVAAAGLAAVSTQRPLGGVSAGFASMSGGGGGMKGSSSSSGLLKVHQQHLQQQQQRQQQLVQAPSSAPAAPRGMLGQLLLANSGPTSPAFSPRGSVAPRGGTSRVVAAALAAAASGMVRDEGRSPTKHTHVVPAARGGEDAGAESDSSSSSGTSSAADGIISSTPTPRGAIIIRPNPLVHHVQQGSAAAAAAAAAGGGVPATAGSSSPGGSSSYGSHPSSLGSRVLGRRAIAGQGFAGPGAGVYPMGVLGVQPGTPGMGAPHSYMSSSPQLPFAFTPSGASLGTSLMSLAETQRQLLPPGALGAANSSSSSNALKQLPAPLSRPGTAAAAAAVTGSVAGGSGSTDVSAAAAAAAGGGSGAGSSAAVPAAAGPNAGVIVGSQGAVAAVGTPSPPLLYAPIPTTAGQVSFIRDISGLATIRRPSWSSRSSSMDIAAAIGSSATLPHHYSMSPGMVELLDPSLMLGGYSSSHGSSAPGNVLLRGAGSGSSATGQGMPAGVQRWNLGQQQQQQGGVSPGGQVQQQQLAQQQGEGHQLGQGQQQGGALASTAAAADGAMRCDLIGGDVAGAGAGDGGVGGPEGTGLQAGSDSAHCAASAGASSGTSAAASAAARAAAEEAFGCSVGHDESESDLLPFVLDAEPAGMQQQSHGFNAVAAAGGPASAGYPGPGCWGPAGQQGSHLGPAGRAAAAAAAVPGPTAAQKDEAVGAFLHMVQEAAAAPVVRLDRRQALWSQQGAAAGEGGGGGGGAGGRCGPVCVGDAVTQVQDLAAQLQQLLFPESFP